MFHVDIMPFATCFLYTSYHFYAFSGTNLLTMPQCQFMFSAVFVFQKSCSGNILGIGRHKARSPYFSNTHPESERESKRGQGQPHPRTVRVPLGRATTRCGAPGRPPTFPFRLYIGPDAKTLKDQASSTKSSVAPPPSKTSFRGQKSLFRHPAGMGNCPRSHLKGSLHRKKNFLRFATHQDHI